MNQESTAPRSGPTALWVRLVALWILAGAGFKLFLGTPADLPKLVRDHASDLGLAYKLAITIELAIAFTALLRPRWGWWLQVLLLGVFDVVLTTQIAAGEANCGCFGAKVSVPPKMMLAIDSVLLLGLLALRPWSRLTRGGIHWLAPTAALGVALTLPWIFDREVVPGSVTQNGTAVAGAYQQLDIEKWPGQQIFDTPLAVPPLSAYIDVNALPLDGLWVFYRASCDHCAALLKHLSETEHGERLIALVQLEEKNDSLANQAVHEIPDGNFVQHARLPASITYLLQAPGELLLAGGKIVAAQEAVTPENGL